MSLRALSIAELMARIQQELDAHAYWEELLRRVSFLATIHSVRRPFVDEQDVIQAVMIKLLNPDVQLRVLDAKNATPYLYSVIKRTAADMHRAADRRDKRAYMWGQETDPSEGENWDARWRGTLLQAMTTLRADERELLYRRYFQDETTGQIADSMGIAYSTVAVRLHRLIIKMRGIIGEMDPPSLE